MREGGRGEEECEAMGDMYPGLSRSWEDGAVERKRDGVIGVYVLRSSGERGEWGKRWGPKCLEL